MKKLGAMLLSIVMLCVMVPGASAVADSGIQPMWDHICILGGTIDITSFGNAKVTANVRAYSDDVTNTSVTGSLQQLKNNYWTEVKSWTVSSDGLSANLLTKTWPVAHGYSYRLVVTGKTYSGSTLLESASYVTEYGYYQ